MRLRLDQLSADNPSLRPPVAQVAQRDAVAEQPEHEGQVAEVQGVHLQSGCEREWEQPEDGLQTGTAAHKKGQ